MAISTSGRSLLLGLLAVLAIGLPIGFVLTQPPSSATGIVVAIRHDGPLSVSSFDLRTIDGQILTFDVGPLDLGSQGFDAAHLTVHLATSQPVKVSYRHEGDRMVATRLSDAPGANVPAPS